VPKGGNSRAQNGHSEDSLGLLTKRTPAVDGDIYDATVSAELRAFARQLVGDAPVRIGQAPKFALIYRTDKPFRKVASRAFIDDKGRENKVEILCDGQQLVCFAIHPDINQPYEWGKDGSPATIPRSELPTITEAQAREIVAEFERVAIAHGWKPRTRARETPTDDDDLHAEYVRQPRQHSEADPIDLLKDALTRIDPDIGHDQWFSILAGIHHELADEGKELAEEWSRCGTKYNQKVTFNQTWNSLGKERAGSLYGIGTIFKIAEEEYRWAGVRAINAAMRRLERARDANTAARNRCLCTDTKRSGTLQFIDFDEVEPQLENLYLIKRYSGSRSITYALR
jgi:hypothetical protein